MFVELVRVTTGDGVRLDGALAEPAGERHSWADAAILVHGTGSNFYGSTLLESVAERLIERGVAALRVNTRGHDGISTASTASGGVSAGAAYEIIDDCRADLAAWAKLLRERGHERILLVGHSLGALKCLYFALSDRPSDVVALACISPPRLSHSRFAASARGPEFLEKYAQAEAMIAAGQGSELMRIRFPIPYLISARGYVDKYGVDERYNVLRMLPDLRVPALVTYGSAETVNNPPFEGLPDEVDTLAREHHLPIDVAVVAGADHFYAGCRAELLARVDRWLKKSRTAVHPTAE